MPGTASTRNSKRAPLHGRHSAPKPQVDLSQAPVLFRFPEIEMEPVDLADAGHAAVESDAGTPVDASVAAPNLNAPASVDESDGADVVQAERQAAVAAHSDFDAQVTVALPSESTAGEVVTPNPDASASEEPETAGSWWEHWSSGVVLILLIIALVTASIIAFNDSSETDPNLLAETETVASADESTDTLDLANISIPGVDASAPASNQSAIAPPAGTAANTFGANNQANGASAITADGSNSTANGMGSQFSGDQLSLGEPAGLVDLSASSGSDNVSSDISPEQGLSFGNESLELSPEALSNAAESAVAMAREVASGQSLLQTPGQLQMPELPTETASSNAAGGLLDAADALQLQTSDSQTAVLDSEQLSLPPMNEVLASELAPQSASPEAAWPNPDGTIKHAATSSTGTGNMANTQLPPYESLLPPMPTSTTSQPGSSNETSPFSTASMGTANQAAFGTASHTQAGPKTEAATPADTPQSQPANDPSGVLKTDNPEMFGDELIRTWQQFRAESSGGVSNRYPKQ